MIPDPAVVVVTPSALPLARRIAGLFASSAVHGPESIAGSVDETFARAGSGLATLFLSGQPIVAIMAAAIPIRLLAPLLGDKANEAPVIAVAEDGSAVVPLLGGHHGANMLARRIADLLGVEPAITTASDVRHAVPLDEPPPGWVLANPEESKPAARAILSGAPVTIDGPAPWLEPLTSDDRSVDPAMDTVTLSATVEALGGDAGHLVYHPLELCLGVGCERGASADEIVRLVTDTLDEAGLSIRAVAGLFSLDLKVDEAGLIEAARTLGVPFRVFDAATLEVETPRLANPSEVVFNAVGCHGVAEGAALAAAGPSGALIVAKQRSRRATVAVARAPVPVTARTLPGRGRGTVSIVGLGPGTPDWRTPEAVRSIAEADHLVGYDLYLDQLPAFHRGRTLHRFPLGAETERARHALSLAAKGERVALISSGDAGIYAMATLVFEEMDRAPEPDWNAVDISVTPGISAFQAASARLGAPFAHDFCTISLSDLLTPRAAIEKRLDAAAAGDFVVALYNPVSRRRRDLLPEARTRLLTGRPPETPVAIARNLGRADERITLTTLGALDVDQVDMLSVVIIGSSETRRLDPDRAGGTGPWLYTPRGYANKVSAPEAPTQDSQTRNEDTLS